MTNPTPRWAFLATVLLATFSAWVLLTFNNDRALALDNAINAIVTAKTARFRMTIQVEDQPQQKMVAFFMEPGRFRQELESGHVNVVDWHESKMMGIDPAAKRVTVFNLVNMPTDKLPANQFEQLRAQLKDSEELGERESLGRRNVGGRESVGFRFGEGEQSTEIWFDPDTELPVRIESHWIGPPQTAVMMFDYEFDIPIDESLFSLEAPAGFEVTSLEVDASPPTERDLIVSLRAYAELADGAFPESLGTAAARALIAKLQEGDNEEGDNEEGDNEEGGLLQEVGRFGRGLQFASQLPVAAGASYAGAGVMLGEDRSIFWYQPPGSTKFRVLQADLSIHEADAAPVIPGAQRLRQQD